MSFFDTIPTGCILNCFAGDLDELDHMLPILAEEFLILVIIVLCSLLIVSMLSLYVLLIAVLLATLTAFYYL